MRKYCDLHTHSVFSDGTYTPTELISAAEAKELSHIALCDHNTVDGLSEFLSAAKGKSVEAVAGAEFSVDFDGNEVHLLGLFLPTSRFAEITQLTEESNRRKEQSNIELISSLNKAGYRLDYCKIKEKTPNGQVNRSHIAEELVAYGLVRSKQEAFSTVLSPEAGHYKQPERTSVWELLDYLVSINSAPILAHPFISLSEKQLLDLLTVAKPRGLVGMECFYSLYSPETTARALSVAEQFGLAFSGGSDFHGAAKPEIALGAGKGELKIPSQWAENIKAQLK